MLPPRYADAKRIGHGAMGDIFAAQDTELERRVAIKVLADRYADDEAVRERFKREALAAARLSGHPHIVTIYDVGEWDGRPFIVMELLTGGTLAERAREQPVPPEHALAWLEDAAGAIDAAHAEGIVHRDVKPANLIFDSRGDLHVVDFGIARVLDESLTGMTQAGTILGTAGYLSPEQARGEPATEASDRYALGVVAYELLTGGRPFARASTTAEAAAHVHEPVPSASAAGVGLPRAVDGVFERALAKDPAARPASARELVLELRRAVAAQPAPANVRRARRRRGPVLVAAALALAGAAAAGVAGMRDDGAPEAQTQTHRGTTVTRTVVQTVTTAPEPPPPPPAPAVVSGSGHSLNDRGYALMQRGDYEAALPLLQSAVEKLRGAGPSDLYEAYANYNLGYVLLKLGRCDEALDHLKRSERLQGSRPPITRAKEAAQGC
jgi:tRNA A-37 threonylcarbamoyl transferase component Bud32/tetratricopeptide (TPR) repeat protein